jgi:hypothetical protein
MQLMLQAAVCDCLALDPFTFEEDGLSAPEVDVSRGKIVEALVIAGMVVVRHEGGDLAFEIAGQVVGTCHENLALAKRRSERLGSSSGRGRRPPILQRFVSENAERVAGNQMALNTERIVDCGVRRQEALG